jgi:raffinose/stachyose/melibiose transport system substrate-binding protein
VVEAVDLLFRDFVEKGYYPEGVNAVTYDDANALFYSGEAAMLPTGTWLVPTIDETVQDFEVGFFAFPSINGSDIAPPAGLGDALFVSKDAENPEGAIQFIDYLLQEETVRKSLETFNNIPAQPVETDGLDVSELFKSVLDDLSAATEAGAFGYNLDVLTPANFNEVMFTGFQEVLGGSRTPQEQVTALQVAWEKAKEQGKIATPE